MRALLAKTLALFGRERLDDELSEEIETHIALMTEENVRRGMSVEQARTAALRDFGGITQTQEKVRTQRGFPLLESIVQDVGFTLRQLKKSPGFTITTVLTLALGIGANLAIFGLLYALVWRSLPVPDASHLVKIIFTIQDPSMQTPGAPLGWNIADELRRRQRSIGELSFWADNLVDAKMQDGSLLTAQVELVSGNAFQTLRIQPLLGRLIMPADDVPGGPSAGWPVVVSYRMWKEQFHGSSEIVGTHVTTSDTLLTVVGVLPSSFRGVNAGVEPGFYIPMQFAPVMFAGTDRKWQQQVSCFVLGRLTPGVTLAQADAEIESLKNPVFDAALPPAIRHHPVIERSRLRVVSGRNGYSNAVSVAMNPLLLLQGLVLLVLLLCCINVGGLLMARNHRRRHEFAVRAAIGAGHTRLVRQCLTEGLILALAGSLFGVVIAWLVPDVLLRFLSQDYLVIHHDFSLTVFASAAALFTTLLFGTLPALFAGQTSPSAVLSVRSQTGVHKQRLARGFVPLQIGLSLVLVVMASLFARSLMLILREPAGFNVSHIMMMWGRFQRVPREGLLNRYLQMAQRLDAMPGVVSTTLVFATPLYNEDFRGHIAAVTNSATPPDDPEMAFNDVSADYFKTMQIHLLSGREFSWNEHDRSVCILNRSAADLLFPRQSSVGQYVRSIENPRRSLLEAVSCQVVGLVDDAKYASLKVLAPRTIYFPVGEYTLKNDANGLEFMMRTTNDALAIAAYRKIWTEFAPDIPEATPATLQEQMERSIGPERLMSMLSITFAALALLLNAIGLYGLLATNVTQRTGEIGIRLALGASRHTILMMVFRDAGLLEIVGVLLGSIGTFFAVRAIKAMLYNTSPFDPWALIGSAVLLAAVALLAAYIPARRAASIEPMDALRAE